MTRSTSSTRSAAHGRRSEDELTLAKASLTRGYPRNFETAQQVARSVAQLALFDLPDAYFEEFVPKVHAVTADDVTGAARRYIDPARLDDAHRRRRSTDSGIAR